MSKQKEFYDKYYQFALSVQKLTNVPALAILTQAALESAWGKAAPGNMFFGVKDTDGLNGNEQLILTTEESSRSDLKFPVILSVTPFVDSKGLKKFRYRVKDYFRKYDSPEDSFRNHAAFLLKYKRYKKAFLHINDPLAFLHAIADAGYATDHRYKEKLTQVYNKLLSFHNQNS